MVRFQFHSSAIWLRLLSVLVLLRAFPFSLDYLGFFPPQRAFFSKFQFDQDRGQALKRCRHVIQRQLFWKSFGNFNFIFSSPDDSPYQVCKARRRENQQLEEENYSLFNMELLRKFKNARSPSSSPSGNIALSDSGFDSPA